MTDLGEIRERLVAQEIHNDDLLKDHNEMKADMKIMATTVTGLAIDVKLLNEKINVTMWERRILMLLTTVAAGLGSWFGLVK